MTPRLSTPAAARRRAWCDSRIARAADSRVTSVDVARRAGVSQSTVSLVMSGKARGRVSAATEAAVRRAARDIGYRPNAAARALRTGAARSVALIVPDVTNPFFGHVMRGAQAAAWTAGYTVALVDTANDPAWELSSYEALRGGPVDGFLVFGIDPPKRRRGTRG
jgi:DNA-binding LacI/PurR family transcriptional regulator